MCEGPENIDKKIILICYGDLDYKIPPPNTVRTSYPSYPMC